MNSDTGGFDIQALRPADLAPYKALRDAMLAGHEDAFTSSAGSEICRSAESYHFRVGQPGAEGTLFTLCAWVDGQMVGAVTCERDSRAKVAHIGHIVGMMVRNDMQGRGIGRALLGAAMHLARADSRLEQLVLTVTSSNRPATQLYSQAGFTRYGLLPRAIKLVGTNSTAAAYLDKDLMVCSLR